MNSYQKLKIQVQELKHKLMIVCTEPESINALYIKSEEKLKLNLEKSIWAGNSIIKDKI
jgi:hypothetical protein